MQQIDLSGEWTLKQVSGKISIPAVVPGDTHSALLAAGKIPDPYVGMNELDVQWVGREDWEFSRRFDVPDSFLLADSVFLNCDCLDTIAEVFINGQKAGASDNMFVRYRFDVKKFLKVGTNEIRIVFHSAEQAAIAAAKKLPYEVPCANFPVSSPHRNMVRKVQCHGGWDWGICLMVSGIYGKIYLGAAAVGRIEYVYTVQRHHTGHVNLEVICEAFSSRGGRCDLEVAIAGKVSVRQVTLQPGMNTLSTTVAIDKPELWWPAGMGKQHLYDLTVRLGGEELTKKIGLRTLEVVNKEDKLGRCMFFRVNGVDVFCKGANWIPADAFPARQTRAKLNDLLSSAVAANMNMLRVWGGGQYESEDFYQLCDEKGLLIWQDFMFSCSLYPTTPEFLASVRREATHQVKRLRDHACLALWCGDNEVIGALTWYEPSRKNRDRYLLDYNRLNEGVLAEAVAAADPTRVFWPSSPCGGPGDFSDCWHADNRGDMHFWSVWHEGKNFDAYQSVRPRFCSEFGYQSFPSLDLVKTYCPPEQFNVTSPVMEHHQRHSRGNTLIVEMFTRYFRMPNGFENFLYLSQVQQAVAIKTAVEHWRRLRPVCMGTLYWQLNDLWPVCSWSSIEYGGNWKLLHYAARRFYAPVAASVYQHSGDGGDRVEAWVVNDRQAAVKGELTVEVRDFAGKVLRRDKQTVSIPPASAAMIKDYALSDLIATPAEGFMSISLKTDEGVLRNEHFFTQYKKCQLPAANVQVEFGGSKKQPGSAGAPLEVTLSTDKPAFFVALSTPGIAGQWSDNAFTLLPGEKRALTFTPKQPLTAAELKKALKVKHLSESYLR